MKSIYLHNKIKRGKLGVKKIFDRSTCQSVLRLKLTILSCRVQFLSISSGCNYNLFINWLKHLLALICFTFFNRIYLIEDINLINVRSPAHEIIDLILSDIKHSALHVFLMKTLRQNFPARSEISQMKFYFPLSALS